MGDPDADKAIGLQDTVSAVLARSPAVVTVFVRHRMACPGCAMAAYMTIAEAAQIYGLDPVLLVQELEAADDRAAEGDGKHAESEAPPMAGQPPIHPI